LTISCSSLRISLLVVVVVGFVFVDVLVNPFDFCFVWVDQLSFYVVIVIF
jgi:hypothetical protein